MSELPKVSQKLSDPISENLQKLATLFPAAVKDGELDIEALREELGEFAEIQPGDEKYELNWAGKQAAKKEAFQPLLGKTLKYVAEDSKDPEKTKNIYIEGDNLEALKLLRQNYYGAIKMIYIDPPYNTGKDFVYKDNFKSSTEESEEAEGVRSTSGERLMKNEKSSNRYHANWLDMMYPRLKLAKDLLKGDGVIFISIDDHEQVNLKKVCDEIFGEDNFINCLIWKSGRTASAHFTNEHEYILVYAKSKNELPLFKFDGNQYVSDRAIKKPGDKNPPSSINFPAGIDALCEDKVFPAKFGNKEPVEITEGILEIKDGKTLFPVTIKAAWTMKDMIQAWLNNEEVIDQKGQIVRRFFFKENGVLQYEKEKGTIHPKSIILGHTTKQGGIENVNLLNENYFDFPKPSGLIMDFISTVCNEGSIILDFFSGSGTSAHATLRSAAEAGKDVRHIMVQLPEACPEKSEAAKADYTTIAEIGKERIRRAGDKIKAELVEKHQALLNEDGELKLDDKAPETNPYILNPESLDIGFKVFRIEDTQINWLKKDLSGGELVDAEISSKDQLDFVPGFTDLDVVYEIMLRQSSIPLTQPITTLTDIGNRTYLYGASYLICLEEDITKGMVEQLAQLEPTPLKFIFRDSAFGKDIAFKDETFRRLNAEIAKHTDGTESYTVEFI